MSVTVQQKQTGYNNLAEVTLHSTTDAVYGIQLNQEGNGNTSLVDIFIAEQESYNSIYHIQTGNNNYASTYQNGSSELFIK
ncbi:hypothetical protein ACE939_08745 [Aquimarina sp. W85]|uniref:hypothetical protein n=1 Tax=Aquimarina rhodophyticola TaxID=3342246 RepID=UPI00366E480A